MPGVPRIRRRRGEGCPGMSRRYRGVLHLPHAPCRDSGLALPFCGPPDPGPPARRSLSELRTNACARGPIVNPAFPERIRGGNRLRESSWRSRDRHMWREPLGLPPPESSGGSVGRGGSSRYALCCLPGVSCFGAVRPDDSGRGKPGGSRHRFSSRPLTPHGG
jgi:hypothetical protein